MNIRKADAAVMQLWESAVKATHDFLSEEDFLFYKEVIPVRYLPQVDLYLLQDGGQSKGFLGVSGDSLEMLFVDAVSRGKGYGKHLLLYALDHLGVTKVDVNEQNGQAVGFYEKMGFLQVGRSEKDGAGKPYPILHLEISAR